MENGFTLTIVQPILYINMNIELYHMGKHNSSLNPSEALGRSGSYSVGVGKKRKIIHSFHPVTIQVVDLILQVLSNHSMKHNTMKTFVTHSEFRPYITTIGLYNDGGEFSLWDVSSHNQK